MLSKNAISKVGIPSEELIKEQLHSAVVSTVFALVVQPQLYDL